MKDFRLYILMLSFLATIPSCGIIRKTACDDIEIHKVFNFADSVNMISVDSLIYIWTSAEVNVKRKNLLLHLIPSLRNSAKNKSRQLTNRFLLSANINGLRVVNSKTLKSEGHNAKDDVVSPVITECFVPTIYKETIFEGFLLSPFNRKNAPLYKYHIADIDSCFERISFQPITANTQLITGTAIADKATGRISSAKFIGVFDIIKFDITVQMDSIKHYLPSNSSVRSTFKFLGNKLIMNYDSKYTADSLAYDMKDFLANTRHMTDTLKINKRAKFWSSISDYLLQRIKGNFGQDAKGSYKISPIFNPLQLGYSGRKGVSYKTKIMAEYNFTPNSSILFSAKSGYSFKLQQFQTNIPVKVTINKKKNMFVETEFGTGNRIANSEVLEQLKNERFDSIEWDKMHLEYFKDMYVRLRCGIDPISKMTVKCGLIFHNRSAVNKKVYMAAGKPYRYRSLAPTLQIQYRPWHNMGPIFTVDYECGITGFANCNTNYERVESDISWKTKIGCLRTLLFKTGGGFYTSKSKGAYFLDYNNFKYETMPGGWDDDWTGEFQILDRNWYNASEYYIRGNMTFESPMLMLAWMPFVGKCIQMERLYANLLFVDKLHPYVEAGYALTTSIFSAGIFTAMSNKKFEGVGVRFALELFGKW